MKTIAMLFLLAFTGFGISASITANQQMVQLRDMLDSILEENDIEKRISEPVIKCPPLSCTTEELGCHELATDANGCPVCKCAEEALPTTPNPDVEADRGICMLIPDGGPCKGNYLRYYFNSASNQCETFIYGGCEGNENNFESLEKCSENCETNDIENPVACPLHSCTPEILKCPTGTGLATNENGCKLCECGEIPKPCPAHSCNKEMLECAGELAVDNNGCKLCKCAVPCPVHACSKETLGCVGELARNENGCEICKCDVPCPLHACTKETMGCTGELARNENGCELCQCAEAPIPCPAHACTKENLGCFGELAIDENGCKLCKCAAVACPYHACTKEMLGCSGELARNENGCTLCECESIVIVPPAISSTEETVKDKGSCMLVADPGPCKAMLERYHFNRARNICEKFIYGGCYGNKNNFEKLEDCEKTCGNGIGVLPVDVVPSQVPCPLHSCTPEMLNCPAGTGLATNENGCELCECKVAPCFLHSCTKEMLECPGELARNENGCELCECAVPCPLHACTKETMGCTGELARNENGCELCQCAEAPIPCPAHACTKENLGCFGELAIDENGCKLCKCAEIAIMPNEGADAANESDEDRASCMLISDHGPCKGSFLRYYFNRFSNKCEAFIYGGCYGNKNNFEKKEDCSSACENNNAVPPSVIGK